MKFKNILLVLIIGILSLNLIFAGSIRKTYLVSGEFTPTQALIDECHNGAPWGGGVITEYDETPLEQEEGQIFSANNLFEKLFFIDEDRRCGLFIYSPNDPTDVNAIYAQTGLTALAIKDGLKSGISIGLINPSSTTETLDFKVKIKSRDGVALITTVIKVPNPNATGNVIHANTAIEAVTALYADEAGTGTGTGTGEATNALLPIVLPACGANNEGQIINSGMGKLRVCMGQLGEWGPLGLEANSVSNYTIADGAVTQNKLDSGIVTVLDSVGQMSNDINQINNNIDVLETSISEIPIIKGMGNIAINSAGFADVKYGTLTTDPIDEEISGYAYAKVKGPNNELYWIKLYPLAVGTQFDFAITAVTPIPALVKNMNASIRFLQGNGASYIQPATALCRWQVRSKNSHNSSYGPWSDVTGLSGYNNTNCGGAAGSVPIRAYYDTVDPTSLYYYTFLEFKLFIKENSNGEEKTNTNEIVLVKDIAGWYNDDLPDLRIDTNVTKYYCLDGTVNPAVPKLKKVKFRTLQTVMGFKVKNTQGSEKAGVTNMKSFFYKIYSQNSADPEASAVIKGSTQENNATIAGVTLIEREYINATNYDNNETVFLNSAFNTYKTLIKSSAGYTLNFDANTQKITVNHIILKPIRVEEPNTSHPQLVWNVPNTIIFAYGTKGINQQSLGMCD